MRDPPSPRRWPLQTTACPPTSLTHPPPPVSQAAHWESKATEYLSHAHAARRLLADEERRGRAARDVAALRAQLLVDLWAASLLDGVGGMAGGGRVAGGNASGSRGLDYSSMLAETRGGGWVDEEDDDGGRPLGGSSRPGPDHGATAARDDVGAHDGGAVRGAA